MPKRTKAIGGAVLALTCLISGCASMPDLLPDIGGVAQDTQDKMTDDWNSTPAVQVRHVRLQAIRNISVDVPARVSNKKIDVTLPGSATIKDFMGLLSTIGVKSVMASDEVGEEPVNFTTYSGRLGDLLDAISSSRDISFTWHKGVMVIGQGQSMTVYLPASEDLIKEVADDLGSFGATNIVASMAGHLVSFDAPSSNIDAIKNYLEKVVDNAQTIALQVAVITVGLDRSRHVGLDWSRLQMTLGHSVGLINNGGGNTGLGGGVSNPIGGNTSGNNGGNNGNANNGGNSSDGGSGGDGDSGGGDGDSGGGDSSNPVLDSGASVGAEFAGSTLGLVVDKSDFNLQALFSLLSTYGKTQTTQNLVLRTFSGGHVKIRSGATVPYVSGVSVSSTSNSNNLLGGTEVDEVKTGLTLTIDPYYSDVMSRVAMDVDLKLKSIIGYVQLSAGDQIGSLSRPEVQDRSLETTARAAAGQTVVLGGLIYDHLSDQRNSLPGLESWPFGHKAADVQRNALFVVIRPTITKYEFGGLYE